ncbi:MAG TPA: hypothetical protein VFD49_15200 [Candidatus Dormibacteraeota bacterium]|nr:hypothetical protein [Candidatus Dormibacteraeota bacterium]
MRRSSLDLLLPLTVTAAEVVAVFVVIGVPDLMAAVRFLTTTTPTMQGSVAAAEALVWIALLAALAGAVVTALTGAAGVVRGSVRTMLWSLGLVVVGLVILGAGVHRHVSAESVDLAGGSLSEARAQVVVPPDR